MTQRHWDLIQNANPVIFDNEADLPEPCRNAVWQYMREGDVGDDADIKDWLTRFKFVVATVPMQTLVDAVLHDAEIRETFPVFQEYSNWYKNVQPGEALPDHGDSVWPPLLSGLDNEVFQDGWHRFHSYYAKGLREIPVLGLLQRDESIPLGQLIKEFHARISS